MSHNNFGNLVNPTVEDYLEKLVRPRDKVLVALEKDAELNSVPIIGAVCANVLSFITTAIGAKNILEIGTATGYSGIWLARVAKKNSGKLTTIENDQKRYKTAEKSFSDAGLGSSVEMLLGDAMKIAPEIAEERKGKFDAVFLDVGDKSMYVNLLEPCIDAVRIGGCIMADNTLLEGRVSDPSNNDSNVKLMRDFNKLVYKDKRLLPIIVPLRDGMTLALKIDD